MTEGTQTAGFDTCAKHPQWKAPLAFNDASRHLCPLCAQEQRAAAYAEQKEKESARLLRIRR